MSLRDIKGTIRDALPHFDGIKLRRRKSRPLLPGGGVEGTRQRSFGSIFSFADSIKANVVSRTGSVRVTRQERKTVRAQDIFFGDGLVACVSTTELQKEHSPQPAERYESRTTTPNGPDDCGRSSTPMTPVVLKKALLPISAPDDNVKVENSPNSETDVSVPEFEGYLDILSYLQRDLPEKPTRARCTPSPPMVQVTLKTPKEEEWMSCRSPSQSSISNRSPSRSGTTGGGLSRTNSNTTKTVTPMSSVDSDSEFRLYPKQSAPTVVESRIEEVSEPETASPHKTPKRHRACTPSKCFHCGRDPYGPDPEYTNSSSVTVLRSFEQEDDERILPEEHEKVMTDQSELVDKRATGPSIPVEDARGQRYLLYPQTSFYEAVDQETKEVVDEEYSRIDEADLVFDDHDFEGRLDRPIRLCENALDTARRDVVYALGEAQKETRFWDDEEEDEDSNLCTPTAAADPYERPFNPDPYSSLDSPSFAKRLQFNDEEEEEQEQDQDYDEELDTDDESGRGENEGSAAPTFWKDPNGVIVVYQGIEVNGKQMFYGADINYLGSYYDDEEDSSGLGSSSSAHHSPSSSFATTPTGLFVIPEVSFSDDFSDEDGF